MKFYAALISVLLFVVTVVSGAEDSNQFPGIVTDETFTEKAFRLSGGFLEKDDLITSMLFLEYLYMDLTGDELDKIFTEIGDLYRKIEKSVPENDLESALFEIYVNLIDFAPETMDGQPNVTYVSEIFTTGSKDCDTGLFVYYAFLQKLGLGDKIRFRLGKSHLTMELPDNRIFESNMNFYLEKDEISCLVKDPVLLKAQKNRFFFKDLTAYIQYANMEDPVFEQIDPSRYIADRYKKVAHNTAVDGIEQGDYDKAAIAIDAVRILKK